MKTVAAIHTAPEQPLIVDELDLPDPQPDQVIVKLFSSGVCHSQLHQMHNATAERPMVLGHEGTGVVTHVGSNVTHVLEGDHAIVPWVPRPPHRGRGLQHQLCGCRRQRRRSQGPIQRPEHDHNGHHNPDAHARQAEVDQPRHDACQGDRDSDLGVHVLRSD